MSLYVAGSTKRQCVVRWRNSLAALPVDSLRRRTARSNGGRLLLRQAALLCQAFLLVQLVTMESETNT